MNESVLNVPGVPIEFASSAGRLRGERRGETLAFRGVPYAVQPTGMRRFRAAQPLAAWSGTLEAVRYGASAMQLPVAGRAPEFAWLAGRAPISEACLSLNITVPAHPAEPLPVVVYLHGGAYAHGSSSAAVLDGHQLASTGGVMVVTLNHRLGIFGFLGTGRADLDGLAVPNVGISDLVCALHWIRAHCASFGGDPTRVTIMGQSGGAGKVAMLMMAPAAQGLFHRAILQSTATAFHLQDPQRMEAAFERTLARLGAADKPGAALLGASPASVLECGREVVASCGGFDPFRPSGDGRVLPAAPSIASRVPVLVGHTSDEADFYLLEQLRQNTLGRTGAVCRIARFVGLAEVEADELFTRYLERWPEATPIAICSKIAGDYMFRLQSLQAMDFLAEQELPDVYAYEFAFRPAAARAWPGAAHTAELPFVFGNLDVARELVDDGDDARNLSRIMMESWIAFAATGSPAVAALPDWPRYEPDCRPTMMFDQASQVRSDPVGFARGAFAGLAGYEPGSPMSFVADGPPASSRPAR